MPISVGPKYGRFRSLSSDLCGLFSSMEAHPNRSDLEESADAVATNTDTWFAVTSSWVDV